MKGILAASSTSPSPTAAMILGSKVSSAGRGPGSQGRMAGINTPGGAILVTNSLG
jgi:hypothetical protein